MRGHRLRLLLVLALLACGTVAPTPAAAEISVAGSLRLMDQTTWVDGSGPFHLAVHVSTEAPVERMDLVVTVYTALGNRSSFSQSLDDKIIGSPIILERRSLADVLRADGTASIDLPVQDPTQRRYYLKDDGVYPVRVDLRDAESGATVDRFVTHLIDERTGSNTLKLNVTSLLPVAAAAGGDETDTLAAPDDGAPFRTVAAALSVYPGAAATALPSGESVERLGDVNASSEAKGARDALASSTSGRRLPTTTWVGVGSPMFQGDLAHELSEQLDRASTALSPHFGAPDPKTFSATTNLDATALSTLRSRGFERVVLPEGSFASTQKDTTLVRPFSVTIGKNRSALTALQTDGALSDHFDDPGGPALGAHRLLADLAVIWNDHPSTARVAVVEPRAGWTADPTFLQTYLSGLVSSPMLQGASLDQAFAIPAEPSGRGTLTRTGTTTSKLELAAFPTARTIEARHRLDGFSSMVLPSNPVLGDLQRRLLLAEAAGASSDQRNDALTTFGARLDAQLAGIHMPPERAVRLTARGGEVPVSIQNDNGYEVHVKLRVVSDKLSFPAGNARDVEVSRDQITLPFAIEARTSGAFPAIARVESPDGTLLLAQSKITIHSTATSGVGVGLSIGAGVVLAVWWMRSILAARRKKAGIPPTP